MACVAREKHASCWCLNLFDPGRGPSEVFGFIHVGVGHKKKGGGVQFLQQHVAGNVNEGICSRCKLFHWCYLHVRNIV